MKIMKPEMFHSYSEESCHVSSVETAKEKGKYIRVSISKEDIGHLLQGRHIELFFPNNDCQPEGMLDIGLIDGKTEFEVSYKLIELIKG